MSLSKEGKILTDELVKRYNENVCPKCNGYLHSLPQKYEQNFCFNCGIEWNLQELEDFCLEKINELKKISLTEQTFISWCRDMYKRGILNEINS